MLTQSSFRIRCFWRGVFHGQFEGAGLKDIRVLRLDIMAFCLGYDKPPKAYQIARFLAPLCGENMLQPVSIYVYKFADYSKTSSGEAFSQQMIVKLRKSLKKDGQEVRVECFWMYSPEEHDRGVIIDRQEDTDVAVETDSGEDSMSELD
jgi:hypothetical protein